MFLATGLLARHPRLWWSTSSVSVNPIVHLHLCGIETNMLNFLVNERLPYSLGWSKPEEAISQDVLFDMLERVFNATGSSPEHAASMIKRGDLHAGLHVVV